ncbi:MAG: DUF4325 domain-containing protein [Deltaproteobacteria bacterium]|nr:DUF4325 domain-containing protein [Deltaproteobacteria bacterium]
MGTHSTTEEIKRFIINNVEAHPADLTAITAKTFGISRQAVNRHLQGMLKEGALRAEGATRNRKYFLKPVIEETFIISIKPGLQEDKVWREMIEPLLKGVKENVLNICYYGFTEMLNNVFDHAEAKKAVIHFERYLNGIYIWVIDNGVGIFNKIAGKFHLDDQRHAILELSKGKLTTDPKQHTGQGIFFTSRAFDAFDILSGRLILATRQEKDWLLEEPSDGTDIKGTEIVMKISTGSERTLKDVFDRFVDVDYGFTKTIVPVDLVRYGAETLVSRSQAKRLMARLELFKEALLDFEGVPSIGQAFTDEIFRVYQNAHPEIKIQYCNATEEVEKMIKMVKTEATRKAE